MHARRRFHDTDESVALIVSEQQSPVPADDDDTKKYANKWHLSGLAGYLPTQLTQAVYTPLQQLQHFHQNTVAPQFSSAVATPVRYLLEGTQPDNQQPSNGGCITGFDNSDDGSDDIVVPELIVMASRDRTLEFGNAIRTLQSRNITRAVNVRDAKKAAQLQSYSEFMMIAKHVGKNIASTYTKLEKLTLCEFANRVYFILFTYFWSKYVLRSGQTQIAIR